MGIVNELTSTVTEQFSTPEQNMILDEITDIKKEIEDINIRFTNQMQVKDDLLNKLHQELEYYKKDHASKFENQLLKAVIKIRHDMKQKLASASLENCSAGELLKEYTYIFQDITDLLEQQNCDEIISQPGDIFDPAIHQAKIEQTTDEALDKSVKESVREGYKKGDKVLIPERVLVYQYNK